MRKSRTKTKRESRAVWLKRYQQWQASDLSKARFCKQKEINTTCFYYWCNLFRKASPIEKACTPKNPLTTRFLPVEITEPNIAVTIECNDIKLSCSSGLSGEQLTEWVKALRKATCSA